MPCGDVVDGQVVVEEVEAGALVGLKNAEEVGNCYGFWIWKIKAKQNTGLLMSKSFLNIKDNCTIVE